MNPTRVRVLAGFALLAAAVGWGAVRLLDAFSGRLLPVPWLAPVTLWLLAAAVLVWALLSRPPLQRRPGARPMPPLVAARTAALAMASSRAGAVVGGFYAGVAVAALPALETPAGQETTWAALAAALGSFALVAAALWLEHLCRLPQDPDAAGGSGEAEPDEGGSRVAPASRAAGSARTTRTARTGRRAGARPGSAPGAGSRPASGGGAP